MVRGSRIHWTTEQHNRGTVMTTTHHPTMIGTTLRQIRQTRGMSLRDVADHAGLRQTHLNAIENGQRAITSMTEVVNLATALQVAPSELTRPPVPGQTDVATENVRLAVDAVDIGRPGGNPAPPWVLRDRVWRLHQARRACQFATVAVELPQLIRDVHASLETGNRKELLDLAVYLHVHVTRMWLTHTQAPTDLLHRTAFLAQRTAEESGHLNTIVMAAFGVADTLGISGSFGMCHTALERLSPLSTTTDTAGLVCVVALLRAVCAQRHHHPGEMIAAIDEATDVADRFGTGGEVDSLGFHTGPLDVAVWRMFMALEDDDPDEAVAIAEETPPWHPFEAARANYWMVYGRALTRVGGRDDAAGRALLVAEGLFPVVVHRDPLARDAVAELVTRGDTVGDDLRGLAFRAGLLV